MDQLNLNNILERNHEKNLLINTLTYFEKHKNNVLTKRGIYVYGAPGSVRLFC